MVEPIFPGVHQELICDTRMVHNDLCIQIHDRAVLHHLYIYYSLLLDQILRLYFHGFVHICHFHMEYEVVRKKKECI